MYTVALYIDSESEPLIVDVPRQLMLGRTALHNAIKCVDLSKWSLDYGISRQHAALRWVHSQLMVEDMGSSNGTWLNNILLYPFRPEPIMSGALLRLGKLDVGIYLAE